MARYKAVPGYVVKINNNKYLKFDGVGEYETEDKAEVAALDALTPLWAKRIDGPKLEPEESVVAAVDKPKRTAATRKPSAK